MHAQLALSVSFGNGLRVSNTHTWRSRAGSNKGDLPHNEGTFDAFDAFDAPVF
jgi:hypothetical protein